MSDDELIFAGIAEQARRVRIGEVGARELVEATLRRIEALDPRLNAFRVVLGERALSEADHAEARRREGDGGPLLGVPGAVRRRWRPGWSARRSGPTAVARSGSQRGLPLAVQLVGRPWEESTLLSLAAQLEAARPWADRRPPIA